MTIGNFHHLGQVNVLGNVIIKNYKEDQGDQEGNAKIIFNDENVCYYSNDGNGMKQTNVNEYPCYVANAEMLSALMNLDTSDGGLSIKDLEKAHTLKGKRLGDYVKYNAPRKNYIKDVDTSRIDQGIVILTSTSGDVLYLDVETDKEAQDRINYNQKYNLSGEERKKANTRGEKMQDCLHGWTWKSDMDEFKSYVSEVSAGDVLDTLKGFEYEACDDSTFWHSERFFQQLFTENTNKSDKKNIAKKIIDCVLERISDYKKQISSALYNQQYTQHLESKERDKFDNNINTLNTIEIDLKNVDFENNMTNSFGKSLDNKMHQLFEIFKIQKVY